MAYLRHLAEFYRTITFLVADKKFSSGVNKKMQ
jgi:hypothetical protein